MKKILLAALAGGLVLFAWGAVSHMATPLGEMGLKNLPDEGPVLTALGASIPEAGLYFYPGLDMKNATDEQRAAWEEKIKSGPSGLLLYRPSGGEAMSPRQLGSELVSNIFAAWIAAIVVSMISAPFGRRVLVIGLLGLFAWLSISASYWIWYGFPTAFVGAELIDQVVGWLLAGLAIAKIVPRPAA
ncbi:MAG TPA: hypothetical protein VN851_08850 [Thermoanaerobaculia bacterium]|nr:hypothetical protein [Thermoanaerobaculia bacterium]